jgi:hypothetical protein
MIQHGDALLDIIPDAIDQMVKMFELFKAHNVYKRNNAMCNLTVSNGKIKAFDFKYAIVREPEHRNDELHSIDTWLSKIDPTLCQLLRSYV